MRFAGVATVENVVGVSRQGQTLPIFVQTEGGVIYLAKYASRRSTLSSRELVVELIANFVGQLFGLCLATPAILKFSQPTMRQTEALLGSSLDSPEAIGLEYTPIGPFLVPSDIRRVPDQVKHDVFLLDLLLANGDRVPENPNVAWAEQGLLVFDHEHCLEFPNADMEQRFQLHRQLTRVTAASHLFQESEMEMFSKAGRDRLAGIDVSSIAAVPECLPSGWKQDYEQETKYLEFVISQADRFLA